MADNEINLSQLGFDDKLYRGALVPSLEAQGFGVATGGTIQNAIGGSVPSEQVLSGNLNQILFSGKQAFDDTTAGFRMGLDEKDGIYKWIIGDASSSVDWAVTTAATLTVKGTIVATSGTIGGWTINATTITGGNATLDSTGVITLGTGDDVFVASAADATYRLWIGNATAASAPFSVSKAGAMVSSSGTIAEWVISGATIYSLDSGTPQSSPNNGVILDSSNKAIYVYEGTTRRVALGYVGAGNYGIKGYATNGSTVIFEISDAQQKIAGWTFDNLKLSAGSVSIDGSTERLLFGSATAPLTGVGIFIGKDGSDYEIRAGDPDSQFFHWNGNALNVEARISYRSPFTFGMDASQGDILAIESDGQMYRTRVTAEPTSIIDSENSAGATGIDGGNSVNVGYVETESTITSTIFSVGNITTTVVYRAAIVTHEPFSIGSISDGDVFLGGSSPHVGVISDRSVAIAFLDSTTAKGKVASGLQSGVSLSAEATISTNAGTPKVARYSDTSVLCVYRDTGTDDLVVRVLTIASNAISVVSSATTLLTGTIGNIWDFKRLGSSNYYYVTYADSGSDQNIICFEYNGSTFSVGAELEILDNTASVELDGDYLDTAKLALVYKEGTALKTIIVSRSGTTLTKGSAVTIETDGGSSATSHKGAITRLGRDSFLALNITNVNAGAGDVNGFLMKVTGTVPSQIGSSFVTDDIYDSGATSFFNTVVKMNPKVFAHVFCNDALDYHISAYAPTTTLNQACAVAADNVSSGNAGDTVLTGYSDDFTGLTPGTPYYVDLDGELITRTQGGLDRFGIGLSTTELKVEK